MSTYVKSCNLAGQLDRWHFNFEIFLEIAGVFVFRSQSAYFLVVREQEATATSHPSKPHKKIKKKNGK